ncbi:MAG: hypothetical protein HYU70_01180 [Bacteroidetes bacterium]|nr:hypothetical protein [Bacteroidota bacterium]
MNDNRKTDLAFKLLDNVQNLIKFADTKINVLLVISGVTTTFILTNFQGLFDLCLISKIVLGLFFLSFLVFIVFSILTISPRKDNHTGNSVSKTIYFEHIASRVEVKDFINDYTKLDEPSFQSDLLYQVFENSKIADKKFKFYKKSLIALQVQLLLFFILVAIKFFA